MIFQQLANYGRGGTCICIVSMMGSTCDYQFNHQHRRTIHPIPAIIIIDQLVIYFFPPQTLKLATSLPPSLVIFFFWVREMEATGKASMLRSDRSQTFKLLALYVISFMIDNIFLS